MTTGRAIPQRPCEGRVVEWGERRVRYVRLQVPPAGEEEGEHARTPATYGAP
jgi:hypothetical protein